MRSSHLNTLINKSFRFGFQGQEGDDEIKGDGNSVNYSFRMHDPRLGRFFAVDPLSADYPHYTPYSFSGNEVISKVELEGLEPASMHLKQSNVGKSFIAVSQATGQEGQKYSWKLKSTYNSIYWVQGNLSAPKPKPVTPVKKENESSDDAKWASAVKLENTLNKYSGESWNAGNYWDALSWKISAWSSGLEGDVGFKRKGIPLMAGTVTTILTFGSGSLFAGSVTSGVSNGAGNFFGQWAQTDDIYEVDGWSVGLSGIAGAFKNPWYGLGITSTADALLDVKVNSGFSLVGTDKKSLGQGAIDLGFGLVGGAQGNLLMKSGVSDKILNKRAIIVGGTQQYLNGQASDKLEKQ